MADWKNRGISGIDKIITEKSQPTPLSESIFSNDAPALPSAAQLARFSADDIVTAPSPPIDDGVLHFRVYKSSSANNAQAGSYKPRILEVCVLDGSLRIVNQQNNTRKSVNILNISQIEKFVQNEQRCRLIFFGDIEKPLEFTFQDAATREGFCELLQNFNPNIVFHDHDPAWSAPKQPEWVDDADAPVCMRCGVEFGLLERRHHCRLCGCVCCSKCSPHTAVLPNLGYDKPVRVCFLCHDMICKARVIDNIKSSGRDSVLTAVAARTATMPAGLLASTESKRAMLRPMPIPIVSEIEPETYDMIPSTPTAVERDTYGFTRQLSYPQSSPISPTTAPLSPKPLADFNWDPQRKAWNAYLALNPQIDRKHAQLKELTRNGIPPEMRGSLWQILSGSKDKSKSEAPSYFRQLIMAATTNPTCAAHEIEKDLHRTFPNNVVFETTDGIDSLRRVLLAYSVRNPKIGYCQSMNFICALLLLFMEEEEAFWTLVVIQEDITCVHGCFYYQSDLAGAHIDQAVFVDLIQEKLPRVHEHFTRLEFPLQPLTINWFLCLFVNAVPLETTLRIWDVLFHEGPKILFRFALALLKIHEKTILRARRVEDLMMFLKDVPESARDSSLMMSVCFDPLWIGSFSMAHIDELRAKHLERVVTQMMQQRAERAALTAAAQRRARALLATAAESSSNTTEKTEASTETIPPMPASAPPPPPETIRQRSSSQIADPKFESRMNMFSYFLGHSRPMINDFFEHGVDDAGNTTPAVEADGFVIVPRQDSIDADREVEPTSTPAPERPTSNIFSPDTAAVVASLPFVSVDTVDSPYSGAVHAQTSYTPMQSSSSTVPTTPISGKVALPFHTPATPAPSTVTLQPQQSPMTAASPAARLAVKNMIASKAAVLSSKKPPIPTRAAQPLPNEEQ